MRIDSHQHFWRLDLEYYAALRPEKLEPEYAGISRDFMPEDLKPHLDRLGIERTVMVQVVASVAETAEFMLPLYDQHDFIAGVVGWLDLTADDFADQLEELRRHSGFVGIRPMLQEIQETGWILRPEVKRNISVLEALQFPIDLQIQLRHLPSILELLQEFPQLKAVVDHAAMPNVGEGILDPWRNQMGRLAAYEQVMCKLSGLDFPAGKGWTVGQITPYVRHLIDAFGAARLMWASNWPVCLFTDTSYRQTYDAIVEALPSDLTAENREAIFGANAARFYGLL